MVALNGKEGILMEKIQALLKLWEVHDAGLTRTVDREDLLFRWSTSVLLAGMAVIVVLTATCAPSAGVNGSLLGVPAKVLVTVSVVAPMLATLIWTFRRSRQSVRHAVILERVEGLLHLFDDGYYGDQSALPKDWENTYSASFRRRKTPLHHGFVLGTMTASLIAAVWIVL